jgi:hypothetical protein
MADKDKIILTLDKEHYPLILRQYGLEGAKEMAISMCLKQHKEITEAGLYSCLSMLEIDLERMFPPPKTEEEKAADAADAEEEARNYQEAVAEMEPYMVNGKQARVDAEGVIQPGGSPDSTYPVWREKSGKLTARIWMAGWDWISWWEEDEEEDEEEE